MTKSPARPIPFRGDWAPEQVYNAEAIHHWWNGWMVPNVTTETLIQVLTDSSDSWSMVLSADTARIVSISPHLEHEEITLTPNPDGTWTLDLGWTFEGTGGPYPPPLHTLARPVPATPAPVAALITAATTPGSSWALTSEVSINPGLGR